MPNSIWRNTSPVQRTFLMAIAALLVVCLVAAGVSIKFKESAKDEAPTTKPAMTVSTQTPVRSTWATPLSANGSVTAWQEASVGTEANGLRLIEVRGQVGDKVKAGQVLAVFDAAGVRADVQAARAQVAEASASAAEAKANADRARSLQSSGALSEQQINQLTTAALTAEARVASAQAQLAVQELRLKHTTVLAPDAGVLSARSATVGAVLPAGTELFRLVRQSRLEWRAEVPAADLAQIKPGQSVALRAPGGATAQGKVRTVGPTVDAQNRLGLVYVDLPANTPDAIKPGMFASGDFAVGEQPALHVPQQALVFRDGFSYLFVLAEEQPDGKPNEARVTRLKVQTGRRLGDRIEISQGLANDKARVVVQGAAFLNDGDLVKVVAPTTGAQP